jgi:VanZ family protein
MMKIRIPSHLWRYWVPPILWAFAIMVMSGDFGASTNTYHIFEWVLKTFTNLTPRTIEVIHIRFRQSLHVICYGILSVLWFRSLMATIPERRRVNLILALVLTLGVSLIDEGHQYLVTSRTGSLRDVVLDMAGAILFTIATARYWEKKVQESSEAQPPFL